MPTKVCIWSDYINGLLEPYNKVVGKTCPLMFVDSWAWGHYTPLHFIITCNKNLLPYIIWHRYFLNYDIFLHIHNHWKYLFYIFFEFFIIFIFVVIVLVQFCIILVKWYVFKIIKFGYRFSLSNRYRVYLLIIFFW